MIARRPFGRAAFGAVEALTLDDGAGVSATVIGYGARLQALTAPDRDGRAGDIVLGCDDLEGYLASDAYFGATCGRVANRIARARFPLDGQMVEVDRNHGRHCLHGGRSGFDAKLWTAETDAAACAVRFSSVSEHGEMGFPGRLALGVEYRLEGAALSIVMTAETDRPTVVAMAHHSYFNLSGAGDVRAHRLRLEADAITEIDDELIPTGALTPVAATAFDFREAKPIGADLARLPPPFAGPTGGYDHNFVLRRAEGGALQPAAELSDPASGRRLAIATTAPGCQLFTAGGWTAPKPGKAGARYGRFAGVALETQHFPDSANHPAFPSCRLAPGERYRHEMRLELSTAP